MIAFWVLAGAMTALAAGLILMRARAAAASTGAPDATAVVYRRQLAEIDDLADRGLIAESERKSAHAEAARRLLGAAEAPDAPWSSDAVGRKPVLITAVVASCLALGLYLAVGSPGAPDQPFARRLAQWRATDPTALRPPELAALLQQVMRARPDAEGYRYLAIAESASQNPAGAVRAMRQAVRLAPDRVDLWSGLGEALIYQNGGQVTAESAAAFREVLRRDPTSIPARFVLGQAQVDAGDKAGGVAAWRALLADMPPNHELRPTVEAAINEAQAAPAAPGAQPGGLSADQLTAVRGMVESLAARLQANPADPDGWIRLVRAYAVLGETAKRDEALKTAQARFASRPDILDQLNTAASAEPMK